ncbi:serine hydrolase domain-containing protein [Marinobacter salexigens]|uniref:serine hydrolase domain-containing protein n=1 Tax=Marinobacter salexigens TaxID=1925763 RepID=UPI0013747690|nr:serine hydrolase domain-containing protein [Marinobacter salexigens]
MAAPASQLAYIAPTGELSHCETGWSDGFFGEEVLHASTRFRYASITKTVTAIAIIDLINRGKLSLDDSITDVLSFGVELRDPRVAEITVGHLLAHRGGWDRVRSQDVMFMINHKPWCPESPRKLTETSLMYAPGEKEAYSNLGYCLLGLVAEKVTGKPFRWYVSDLLAFKTTTLRFIDGPYLADEVSYDTRHENFYTREYYKNYDFKALSSSAGLSGNAIDLANLIKASLARGPLTILDGDMVHGCNPARIQECYGFGVHRYQPSPDHMPLYMHGGKLPGVASLIGITPDRGVLVWLGAGTPRRGSGALAKFYEYVRNELDK